MVVYRKGDHIIYRMPKHSTQPGPRAKDVRPTSHGDDYSYAVDKYWTVTAEIDEETIEARTRRGKVHQIRRDDPHLRKAKLLEEMLYKSRFPSFQ